MPIDPSVWVHIGTRYLYGYEKAFAKQENK